MDLDMRHFGEMIREETQFDNLKSNWGETMEIM